MVYRYLALHFHRSVFNKAFERDRTIVQCLVRSQKMPHDQYGYCRLSRSFDTAVKHHHICLYVHTQCSHTINTIRPAAIIIPSQSSDWSSSASDCCYWPVSPAAPSTLVVPSWWYLLLHPLPLLLLNRRRSRDRRGIVVPAGGRGRAVRPG